MHILHVEIVGPTDGLLNFSPTTRFTPAIFLVSFVSFRTAELLAYCISRQHVVSPSLWPIVDLLIIDTFVCTHTNTYTNTHTNTQAPVTDTLPKIVELLNAQVCVPA